MFFETKTNLYRKRLSYSGKYFYFRNEIEADFIENIFILDFMNEYSIHSEEILDKRKTLLFREQANDNFTLILK